MRRLTALLLVLPALGCGDDGTAPPVERPLPVAVVSPLTVVASDVRDRLLPSIEQVDGRGALGTALASLDAALDTRLGSELLSATDAVEGALAGGDAASAADRDAVRLLLPLVRAAVASTIAD